MPTVAPAIKSRTSHYNLKECKLVLMNTYSICEYHQVVSVKP